MGDRLTRAARGRPCQVRLPGCSGGGEDTVLAHYRLAGLNGIGMKPPSIIGAWACFHCHETIDFRMNPHVKDLPGARTEIRLAHAEGCLRTMAALQKEGLLWAD